jgi:predicted ATPase/predicted transcriptional regulator
LHDNWNILTIPTDTNYHTTTTYPEIENRSLSMSNGFRASVKEYLRSSGYSQIQLAHELGLNAKVLSRKLSNDGKAQITHREIRAIITTLAHWHAITTREEAHHLLEEAEVGTALFSKQEWDTPPLSTLTASPASKPEAVPSPDLTSQPLQTRRHNLPTLTTRLIGRGWTAHRLQQLIGRDDIRLITLIGAGGSGKTRLALSVAREQISTFEQGVWFVPLAGVNNPALVPVSILQALDIPSPPGVSPSRSLIDYLEQKQLLLILDNFEQVGGATEVIEEILAAAAGVKILITSRVALRMYEEHAFSVPPLDVPDPAVSLVPNELLHYGAVQLFVERAQAVQPDFALTEANAATITRICARVDGLPLALELAAARIRILPPSSLLERLEQARLTILTGGARNLPNRHHTLRNAITWSYNLLSPLEQRWFCRLSIFTGGWSLEAAETIMQEVVGEDQEVISAVDMLEQLADNSLIVQIPSDDGQARFTMLETLREYALEQLGKLDSIACLRNWHACYYLREAEAGELALRGPQQLVWLARLSADRDNFRAALEWSQQRSRDGLKISTLPRPDRPAEQQPVAGSLILSSKGRARTDLQAHEFNLRLAAALRPYWEWQGYLTEARHWLASALALPVANDAGETLLAARAKALSEAARLSSLENNQDRAKEQVEKSIALWQQLDDPEGLAGALLHRAWVALATSDYEAGRAACQEGLEQLAHTDAPWLRAQLLFYLGAAAGFMGDFRRTETLYGESLELFKQLGDISATADVLKDHGAIIILESRFADSIRLLSKSLELCYRIQQKQYLTTGLCWLSIAAGLHGKPDERQATLYSAQLKGAVEVLMGSIGLNSWAETHPFIQAVEQYIRSRVDEERWEEARNIGRALTIEQIMDLVRKISEET